MKLYCQTMIPQLQLWKGRPQRSFIPQLLMGATMLAEVDVVWQSPQMFQHFNLFQPASTLNPI